METSLKLAGSFVSLNMVENPSGVRRWLTHEQEIQPENSSYSVTKYRIVVKYNHIGRSYQKYRSICSCKCYSYLADGFAALLMNGSCCWS